MNKQPEITDMTRNTFIEVFCAYYQTRSIDKITVKEITEKAGYSRATFYNYFKDVYDLLEHIENEFISSLIETFTNNIESHQFFDDFIHTFVELIESKKRYINVFMNSSNNSSFVNRLKLKTTPLLLSAFAVPQENIRAKYALEFYISGLVPVIGEWLKNDHDIQVEDFANLIKGILQEGILKQVVN